MNKANSNLCIRCGKQRLVVKTWQEKIGYSLVTTKEMACPDSDCQKKVDQSNEKQRAKHEALKLRSGRRRQANTKK